jgi:NRE family putative nickel resistance protein-like MFS transporter
MSAFAASSPSLRENSSFLRLFAAQAVSLAGSGITTVALALLVRELAGPLAAAAILGQALTLRILAFLVFSQPAGILADRMNRKYLLVASDLARFALMAAFPFITTVWQVYVAVFLVNALTAFFTPAYESSLPEITGDSYTKTLAYSRVAIDMEAIAGPVLAGVLVAIVGLHWVFWVDAASYLVSAALVMSVDIPVRSTQAVQRLGLWEQLGHGTRVLFRQPAIRQALMMSLAEAIAGACAIVVTVVYVRDVLMGSTLAFTLVMAGVGVGSSVTAVLLGRRTSRLERAATTTQEVHWIRHRWSSRAILGGGILTIVSLVWGFLRPPLSVFAGLWVMNGAGQALVAIPSSTLVAEHTSEDERGRAFAAHFAWTHASWLVAYPLAGHLASSIGPGAAFSVCGVLCALILLAALLLGGGNEPAHGSHEPNNTEWRQNETQNV